MRIERRTGRGVTKTTWRVESSERHRSPPECSVGRSDRSSIEVGRAEVSCVSNRLKNEVVQDRSCWRVANTFQRRVQCPQMLGRELKNVFVWLIRGPGGICYSRSAGHLDMSAKKIAHRMIGRESNQPFDAASIGRPVGNIKIAWIDGVATQQDLCSSVVERKVCGFVSRNRKNGQAPVAKIESTC